MSEPVVRTLSASDLSPALGLATQALVGSRYLARALELLALAASGTDAECAGMIAAIDGDLDALLLHGPLAGAVAVEKVHLLIGRDVQALVPLIDALRRREHWRMIVCELAEGREHGVAAAALVAGGFTREGSIAGFFDDATDLALHVLRRSEPAG